MPSPTRQRNRRGEGAKLRDLIVEAAAALLAESGQESAVTIRAVAKRAGIAPQSFYLQFANLDELLFVLYQVQFENLHARLLAAVESANTSRTKLRELARAYLAYAVSNPGEYRTLMGTSGQSHPTWERDDLPGAATFGLLLTAVSGVRRAGSSRDDDYVAAALLWSQLHGAAILMLDRPTFRWPTIEDLSQKIVSLFATA